MAPLGDLVPSADLDSGLSPLVADAAGEFANMIAGQAKTMLKGTPYHFTLSPPTVLRNTTSALGPVDRASSVMTFDSELGLLRIVMFLPTPPTT